MDNSAQDNSVQIPQDTSGGQAVVPPQQGTQQQPAPGVSQQELSVPQVPASVPVGGKEHEGVALVQPSHPEVVVDESVQEAGVEAHPNPEVVELTPEQQEAGVEPAKEATPIPQQSTMVNLPLPEEKIQSVLKMPRPKDSITWLAMLLKKILKKAMLDQAKEKK